MQRTILTVVVLIALGAVPAAVAVADGGPSPGATIGGAGVVGNGLRYVTIGARNSTELEAVAVNGGQVRGWVSLAGVWGIPTVTYDGATGGLSHDGSTLVLGKTSPYSCTAEGCTLSKSSFAIYTPKSLRHRTTINLKGTFSFDALSPNGHTLYLIQYRGSPSLSKYLVRAYDLDRERLLPGAIADRTQRGWLMQGQPMTRVSSPDGRFVYTLYENQGGYPFVHALDARRGVAHCIGLPWHGDQSLIADMRLSLRDDGRTLSIADPSVRAPGSAPSFAVDTRTYAVSQPRPGGSHGFPWWTLGLLEIPILAVGALAWRGGSRSALRPVTAANG